MSGPDSVKVDCNCPGDNGRKHPNWLAAVTRSSDVVARTLIDEGILTVDQLVHAVDVLTSVGVMHGAEMVHARVPGFAKGVWLLRYQAQLCGGCSIRYKSSHAIDAVELFSECRRCVEPLCHICTLQEVKYCRNCSRAKKRLVDRRKNVSTAAVTEAKEAEEPASVLTSKQAEVSGSGSGDKDAAPRLEREESPFKFIGKVMLPKKSRQQRRHRSRSRSRD